MKCDHCPAGWESGGMTSCGYECDSYGCKILGAEMLDDDCKLSLVEIEKRLQQLKDYKAVEDLEKIRPYEPNVVKAAWNIFGKSYEYRAKYNAYKERRMAAKNKDKEQIE